MVLWRRFCVSLRLRWSSDERTSLSECTEGAAEGYPILLIRIKQAMPFLTVDAIIGNQAFQNGRCHICFSLGLDRVETANNLLME